MSKKNEMAKTAALSEWIEGVIENLSKLKTSLTSKESLEKLGITSSFQELPLTFDICFTTQEGDVDKTTRIRRELKQALKKRFSSRMRNGSICSGEKYLTYVGVGIEHYEKPAKLKAKLWATVSVVSVVGIVLLSAVGAVALVNNLSSSKQSVEISQSVVRLLNGTTNLTRKAEMSMKYESRGK